MHYQEIIVFAFILAAASYVAFMIYKKTRSFSGKAGCAADCGCSAKTKEPHTAA